MFVVMPLGIGAWLQARRLPRSAFPCFIKDAGRRRRNFER